MTLVLPSWRIWYGETERTFDSRDGSPFDAPHEDVQVVAYWRESRVVMERRAVWREYPTDGVLWVDVMWSGWAQRLAGRDNFWVAGDAFGSFNDPHNLRWYGGDPTKQASAWRALSTGSEAIDPTPPPDAHILRGVLVPDRVWEEVTRANPLLLA